ncbi:MAG: ATP-binding cassette domain-containing protein [Acholeplasmataceae bacterium]
MIELRHLHKYFNHRKKNEIHVINDVSLEFPAKGLVVLHGPSGSGKTTLLNVLGGLDGVQKGEIVFNDKTISKYRARTWDEIRNESVGYIFQNYNLLPDLSVFDNIAFVLKLIGINDERVIEERVNYILRALNMYPYRKKKALQLSGGQQQRVAIARALVKNPEVIIADEPTGNLDSRNTLEIMNIIKAISREKLVVLVTHEKQLAEFYGDRIIELTDGKIVADRENNGADDHTMGTDDTIYLKDLNQVARVDEQALRATLYSDQEEHKDPVSIRLIVKNRTLYLDVDTPIKKVKLADESAGVTIRNESYKKKSREELIETSFELESLDNRNVKREKRIMVSIRNTLFMAAQKFLRTTRKGKIMLFSFMVAGAVIAFTIATLASVLIIEPEPYMSISEGYVSVQKNELLDRPTYQELSDYREADDEDFYINTFPASEVHFLSPSNERIGLSLHGSIDLVDHVSDRDLVAGRMPVEKNDVLITTIMAEELTKSSNGQEEGIWTFEHIFHEKTELGDHEVRIVGIVESEIELIYLDRDFANFAISMPWTFEAGSDAYAIEPIAFLDSDALARGELPAAGEVLISETMYDALDLDPSEDWPLEVDGFDYAISGTFESGGQKTGTLYMQASDIEAERFSSINRVFIYSHESEELADELVAAGYSASDVYEDAYENAESENRLVVLSTVSISALLLGFSLLGFYFVIRSSLISRIYEVSVYRALGVRKKDIFISFLIEILFLTTISTLIGYVLATIGLTRLQEGLLGQFNFFQVTPLTVVAGVILLYLMNVLAGLFPVYVLLRRTPAQILAQYDI